MVAALARIFGMHNLALAEDVVQEAFCRAITGSDRVFLGVFSGSYVEGIGIIATR